MGIIVISRGAYTMGKEVGEEVARRLGYNCLSREELLETSGEFNVPEVRLLGVDPPVLENMVYWKRRYLSFIQSSLFRRLKEDNVVYHGFSGRVFVRDFPGVLKVRVEADLQDRARIAALREGVTQERAVGMVKRIDENRKRWCRQLYGVESATVVGSIL
jgi:hypothetical protein